MIDAHVHVWDPDILNYDWLVGTPADRQMLPAAYRREGGAASGAIFVQAADDTSDPIAEVRWVDGLEWPGLRGIVARVDLAAGSGGVVDQLDALVRAGRVVGVRHLLQDLPTTVFPEFTAGLQAAAARGLAFDACIRHKQLPALTALVDATPDLIVVLDHLGKPPVDEGLGSAAGAAWEQAIATLAARPHTFVKLSGMTAESRDRDTFERNADAFLSHALAVFGPDRAMIASDWPVSAVFGVGGTFSDWIMRVRTLVRDADWPMVSVGAARRAYLPDEAREMSNAAG